jgi:hypothetical protein
VRIQVFPLDFMGQAPLWEPKDRNLHDLAIEYCKRELADEINFVKLNKVWVTAVVDEAGKPIEVTGITGYVLKVDIPVFRVSGNNAVRSTKMLEDRLHAHFADQGMIGQEVFLHISSKENPEQRCPNWEQSLIDAGATPADRLSVIVR